MHIIKESPFYRDLVMDLEEARAEARAEGLAEGLAEGERETSLRNICRLLAYRFGVPVEQFHERLQALGLMVVKPLNDIAFDVASLKAFEEMLMQFEQEAKLDNSDPQAKP